MKKRTAIVLVVIAIVVGLVVGFLAGGFSVGSYVIRMSTRNTGAHLRRMIYALRATDAGDLRRTQKRLEDAIRVDIFLLSMGLDYCDCPPAEEDMKRASQYMIQRQEKTEPPSAGDVPKAAPEK
jgi:hypothetical protein